METRTPPLARLLPFLLVVLLGVLLSLAAWVSVGGRLPLEPKGYRVGIPLAQAPNLNPGADVRSAGVTIGKVVEVARVGRSAHVTVELQRRFAPLHADARARLRTKTLLGEAYLELSIGSRGTRTLPEGGTLAAARVDPATQLDDVLQFLRPAARRDLRRSFAGLATALRGRTESLNGALGRLDPVTADLGAVVDILDGQRGELRSLLRDAGVTFNALGKRDGALAATIRSADRVFAVTASRDRALAAAVRELAPFLRQLRGSSQELGDMTDDLSRAVRAVRPAVPRLRPALSAITTDAPTFRALFRRLPGVIADGNRGLPALTRILRSSGPALRQIYPASRELIPVLELLALIRDQVVSTFADVAQVHGGVAVGPGNRVVNYAIGVIQLWNETIGGWKKRLPSNRGNTYPAPGFLSDLAQGLKSYDCRNLKNVPYLPPFGGAPPCREQGRWTFQGETAYFPHLKPASP